MNSLSSLEAFRQAIRSRNQLVHEQKSRGERLVGYQCIYVPEEIILAAGMRPYHLYGRKEAISKADSYLQPSSCEFVRSIFDQALEGGFDALDGVAFSNTCDAMRRLHDYWNEYIEGSSSYTICGPQRLSREEAVGYGAAQLACFVREMERLSGNEITPERLWEEIREQNEIRSLLSRVYDTRRADPPPITGSEAIEVAMATTIIPREDSVPLLKELLREIEERDVPESYGPRILVTGSIVDDPTLVRMVEEEGGQVVVDDFCNTMRNFALEVEDREETGDPLEALARFNSNRPNCPCMNPPQARFEYLRNVVEAFGVEAVVYFNLKYCHPFMYEAPDFAKRFEELDIPVLLLEYGHDLSGLGQIRTRIQAFIEMTELE